MHIKNKRGQSTVEYVLLFTAVIAVMVAFATSKTTGLQQQLNSTLTTATADLSTGSETLSGSHQPQAANATAQTATTNAYTVKVAP